jgi:hypothetical protein
MARSLIAPWFALSITFPLISTRKHYFSAPKICTARLSCEKWGSINGNLIKRSNGNSKYLCERALKTALSDDLTLYSGGWLESTGVKKARL